MSTYPRSSSGPVLRLWAFVALFALAWLVFAYGVVPRIIRAAYEGRSLRPLNELISGQADHPVDEYLAAWSGVAWRLTIGLAVATILVALIVRFRRPLAAWLGHVLVGPPGRGIGAVGVLMLALGVGMATGLLEAVGAIVHQMILPKPNWMYRPDVLWAAPAVNSAIMMLVTLPVALLLGLTRRRMPMRPLAFALLAVGVYAALRGWAVGLLPYAAALLGAGLAAVTVRRIERARRDRLGFATGGLVFLVVGLAIGIPLTERIAERIGLARASAPADTMPNILLLILDTVRAPELSLYGYPRETAPRLTDIAHNGIVFRRAVAPSSWTLPSHASMFTGVPASRLAADWDVPFGDSLPTLSEVLGEAGYATAGFVANYHYTGTATGLTRGFHHYADHRHSVEFALRNSYLGRRLDGWRRRVTGNRQILDRLDASDVNAMLLDWLPRRGPRPFFAFLNYFDAHDPYLPPNAPRARSDSGSLLYYFAGAPGSYSEAELHELQQSYDAAIQYLDSRVGDLLDKLRNTGVLDSTIVIITSDHGEKFGEQEPRLVLHGNSLYFSALHVPLIVLLPGEGSGPRWIERSVSLTDLPATLLDLAGLSGRLPGRSLASLWRRSGSEHELQPRLSLSEVRPYRQPMFWEPIAKGPIVSLVRGRLHFIRYGDGTEEAFDVVADPWERENLTLNPERAAEVTRLAARLDSLSRPESLRERQ